MATSKLTPTSYAILGLLAVKPWTTYELTQQMHRALGQFWPRAESKLYEEPKKLVAAGLARATPETVGQRPRTVYSITPKGRRAMAAWVPSPGAGPVIEFEQLVKVFFAEHGTKADLLRNIEGVRAWVDVRQEAGGGVSQAYLNGEGAFPERLPWLILCGRFLDDITRTVEDWVDWAAAEVAGWPENLARAEPDWTTLERMAAHNDEYLARREDEAAS
ncbi:MAG: PadR family transcriptional regulator [Actinobacteria bacterium]|nr:PadR family transcriptional regulator [Actinomycetota bacterium]